MLDFGGGTAVEAGVLGGHPALLEEPGRLQAGRQLAALLDGPAPAADGQTVLSQLGSDWRSLPRTELIRPSLLEHARLAAGHVAATASPTAILPARNAERPARSGSNGSSRSSTRPASRRHQPRRFNRSSISAAARSIAVEALLRWRHPAEADLACRVRAGGRAIRSDPRLGRWVWTSLQDGSTDFAIAGTCIWR